MKPGWFERKSPATWARGYRDTQFKAQLLDTIPEDPTEVLTVVEMTAQPETPEH
jgi:hypothetical protein